MNTISKNFKKLLIISLTIISTSIFLYSGIQENIDILKHSKNAKEIIKAKKEITKSIIKNENEAINIVLTELKNEKNKTNFRCSLAEVLINSGSDKYNNELIGLLSSSDFKLRKCIIKKLKNSKSKDKIMNSLMNDVKNISLDLNSKGTPYAHSFLNKLKTIDKIWALGEFGDPKVMGVLEKAYNSADEVIKINIIFSMGKLKTKKVLLYLKKIAHNENETYAVRSAAFAMIDELEKEEK